MLCVLKLLSFDTEFMSFIVTKATSEKEISNIHKLFPFNTTRYASKRVVNQRFIISTKLQKSVTLNHYS